ENALNTLGYELLNADHLNEAIECFRLNAELFPESFNVYDSLAEGYLIQGDRERAEAFYRKSLEVFPGNVNATEKLRELAVQSEPAEKRQRIIPD
ncbi:serine hydrolase, partial [bacterium]|nr:serine hydrolase [candidate division CSSED10-310 bacterium]